MTAKSKTTVAPPKLELVAADTLLPYVGNSRTHSPEQIDQIAASMVEFGFTSPIMHDGEGTILAGHGRLMAARKVWDSGRSIPNLPDGMVPTISLAHLSPAQRRAYVIADNRLAEFAGWDTATLASELEALRREYDYDIDVVGYSVDDLDAMLAEMHDTSGLEGGDGPGGGNTDEDEIPEAAPPVSRHGDLWLLGEHRIICGSSTDAHTVERLLGDERPHLMVTDPPYGVNYDPAWRAKAGVNKNTKKLGKVLNDDKADWREAWALFPGDVAYVWHASMFTKVVLESLEACDFEHRSMIIWAKDRFTLGRGHYHWQHEPAWYVVRKGKTGHWNGDRSQSTVWNIPARDDDGVGHGTQKPVECMRRPILNNSKPGDAVYEPFSGSGTTIIAAETTGRRAFAVELNPAYVDIAVKRWQRFTGKAAVLADDGRTFAEVMAERGVPEAAE